MALTSRGVKRIPGHFVWTILSSCTGCFHRPVLMLEILDGYKESPGGLFIQNNEKCTSEKVLVHIDKPPDNRDLMSTSRRGRHHACLVTWSLQGHNCWDIRYSRGVPVRHKHWR